MRRLHYINLDDLRGLRRMHILDDNRRLTSEVLLQSCGLPSRWSPPSPFQLYCRALP